MKWYTHRYHTPLSLRIVFATIPRMPKVVHPAIAVVTALIFFVVLSAERRAVMRNLRAVTGRSGFALGWAAYRVFYNFCDLIVSYCYVPQADAATLRAMLSDPDYGNATIDACLAGGRGLVVWTAHAGNWEFASRLLELHGRRVNVARVVEPGNSAESWLRDLMTNDRLRVVDLVDPTSTVQLLAALRAGEIVAMQGDRVYRGKGIVMPFFGRPTLFPAGPFVLARVAGVPVVSGLVVRTGWLRYKMLVGPPLTIATEQPQDVVVNAALRECVAFLERHLERWPSQWMNFFDFWPLSGPSDAVTAPEAATSGPSGPSSCQDPQPLP
jgi:KDO2-lipid IV(A) lauroyltransferase